MYKKYVIYAIIIFIAIVVFGNYFVYKTPNKKANSLDFSKVEDSLYQRDVTPQGFIQTYLTEKLYGLINGEYEVFYNALTDECKSKKFKNSLDTFTEVIKQKYFNTMSEFGIVYSGYVRDEDMYMFRVEIYEPIYITDAERKLEVYKPKQFYITVYVDSENNYTMNFDY